MSDVSSNYTWKALLKDGSELTLGGNLENAIRFTLIPNKNGLPEHTFDNIKMKRRFCRAFIKMFSDDSEYMHCIVCDSFRINVFYSDGRVLITPEDYEVYL